MDSCARCGRHLDEARDCPECDAPAAGSAPAPRSEERYYQAKPFPQAPPPRAGSPTPEPAAPEDPVTGDPVTEELPLGGRPEELPADDAADDGPPRREDAFQDATAEHQAVHDGAPADDHEHRTRPRRRILVLATCLGAVLLGATVCTFAGPGLPWGGGSVSEEHGTPPIGTATDDATKSTRSGISDVSPSADTPSANPSEKPTATPSRSGPAQEEAPAPATTAGPTPTQPPAPEPTRSSAAPTPPPSRSPAPSPSESCFLIFCS